MKVLFCIPSMGGGGAERQLTHVARGLRLHGCETHVALLVGGPNLERLEDADITVHQIPHRSNYDPRIIRELLRLMRHLKPDVVHTWIDQMDVMGGIAARIAGIPAVMSEQTSPRATRYLNPDWRFKLRVKMARRAAAIVANSEEGRSYWLKQVTPATMVRVIRNVVPFEEIDRAPALNTEELAQQNIEEDNELVLYAGRYLELKNVIPLMHSLPQTLRERPRAVAVLRGAGPLRDQLLALQEQFALGQRLQVLDYAPNLWSWLKRADCFVSVSQYEGSPNVVMEAIACGCPVVVSDIPAHREFLHEGSAMFAQGDSPTAIADALTQTLEKRDEAQARAQLALKELQQFSLNSIAPQYLNLYASLAS